MNYIDKLLSLFELRWSIQIISSFNLSSLNLLNLKVTKVIIGRGFLTKLKSINEKNRL